MSQAFLVIFKNSARTIKKTD